MLYENVYPATIDAAAHGSVNSIADVVVDVRDAKDVIRGVGIVEGL